MPQNVGEVTPGNLCPPSGHPSFGKTWREREECMKVRLIREVRSAGTRPTMLGELPMSSQVETRLRRDLLAANSYLKGTYFLIAADETASI